MLITLLSVLVVGFILSIFDLDKALVNTFNEIFKSKFTTDLYWTVLVIVGVVSGFIKIFT